MSMGQPGEKSLNFGPSAKRLLGGCGRTAQVVAVVLLLAVVSVTLSSIGPKILGRATDIIFAGVIGRPDAARHVTKEQVVDEPARAGPDAVCRPAGQRRLRPRSGDRLRRARQRAAARHGALRRRPRCSCGSRAGSCRASLSRTMYDLRQEVEAKLNRLPLPYFDNQPRGELLSRVTNDIDNVGQSPAADALASCSPRCSPSSPCSA